MNLRVKIRIPVAKTDLSCDTLFVNTNVASHSVNICVDPMLISMLQETDKEDAKIQVYPNPVSGIAEFDFNVSHTASVKLDLFAMNGSFVKTLYNGTKPSGESKLIWLSSENNVPSGLYCYHLKVGDKSWSGKISVIR